MGSKVTSSLFLGIVIPVYYLLILLLLPLYFLLLLLFFTYRFLLTVLAPILNPALSAILPARSAVYACDLVDPSNARANLVVQFRLDSYMSKTEVERLFRDRILPAKLPDGSLKYPELSQFLTHWGGYYFWQEDKSFDLSEHIRAAEFPSFNQSRDPLYDESDHRILTTFHEKLMRKGWRRGKPIWDFWVVNLKSKEGSKRTVLFFRTNHALGDGYSLYHLFTEYLTEKSTIPPTPVPELPAFSPLLLFLLNLPRTIYDIAFLLAHATGPFTPRHFTMKEVRSKPNFSWSPNTLLVSSNPVPLSVSQIKAVRAHFRTSFSAVLSSIVGGAMRDLLIRKGLEAPEEIPVVLPTPWETKGGRLRNNFGAGVLLFPVSESDAVQRLMKCEAEHLRARKTAEWIASPIIFHAFGCVPTFMLQRFLHESVLAPAFLTSFPAGQVGRVGKTQCCELSFSVGLPASDTGLGFCALSYGDGLKVTAISDSALVSSSDLDFLALRFSVHLAALCELVNGNGNNQKTINKSKTN